MHELEQDIDPDNNVFANLNNTLCYYTDEQYKSNVKSEHGMSVIHFSSRNLCANYQNIKDYLNFLTRKGKKEKKRTFSVIAISQTWLNSEKGADLS